MATIKIFIWLLPGFPLFPQYVSTLFVNTESDVSVATDLPELLPRGAQPEN